MTVVAPVLNMSERILSDRLSPILVKEVRQSLRGRYFTVLFCLTLAGATMIAASYLVFAVKGEPDETAGVQFFSMMYACLSVAVHIFVPFAAYLSLSSERTENTYDLLVLSDLRPRQIIFGKLLSSGVQLLLYFSAFGPFLAFAFLLPGLDLLAAGYSLLLTLISSLCLSVLALWVASLHRSNLVRSFLMALMAVLLVPAAFTMATIVGQIVSNPQFLQDDTAVLGIAATTLIPVYVASFLFALACGRLAHAEENRSTAVRVLITVGVLIASSVMVAIHREVGQIEVVTILGTTIAIVLGILSMGSITEEEALGRRVRMYVPKSPLMRFLGCLYLPGGGRGFLLFLFNFGILIAFVTGELLHAGLRPLEWMNPALFGTAEQRHTALWLGTIFLYIVIYIGLPSVLFSPWSKNLQSRIAARICIPAFLFLGFLLPTVIGYFLGIDGLEDGEHIGNPMWIPDHRSANSGFALGVVMLVAFMTIFLNRSRMIRGVREVLRRSAQRRTRDAALAAGGD